MGGNLLFVILVILTIGDFNITRLGEDETRQMSYIEK